MTQQHDASESGANYTDDDLEREARKVYRERYPGQSWDSDSSARIVSYNQARKRLSTSPVPVGEEFKAPSEIALASLTLSLSGFTMGSTESYTYRTTLTPSEIAELVGFQPAAPALSRMMDVYRTAKDYVDNHEHGALSSRVECYDALRIAVVNATLYGQPSKPLIPATLPGQQGGAVTAGGLQLQGVDGQIESAITAGLDADQKAQPEWAWISYGDDLKVTWGRWRKHPGQAPYIRGDIVAAAINRARLAEQPTPAGTGDADRAEGLRPGIEKAIAIVEAEQDTVSSSSSSYLRCTFILDALRAALDGASGQETTP